QPIKECFTDEAAPTAYALFIGFAICEKLFILAHARHQPTINKKLTRLFWSHIFASPGPTLMAQVKSGLRKPSAASTCSWPDLRKHGPGIAQAYAPWHQGTSYQRMAGRAARRPAWFRVRPARCGSAVEAGTIFARDLEVAAAGGANEKPRTGKTGALRTEG